MDISKEDLASLQEALATIEKHHKRRIEHLEESLLNERHYKAQAQIERNIWKSRYLFLEENTRTIIRNLQLENANRKAEIDFLTEELRRVSTSRPRSEHSGASSRSPDSAPQSPTVHSRHVILVQTREKQLERLATQLDNVNGHLEQKIGVVEDLSKAIRELEVKYEDIRYQLDCEKALAERLNRQLESSQKNNRIKKLFAAAAIPMSIPTVSASQQKDTDAALIQFMADLRTELASINKMEHEEEMSSASATLEAT